MMEEPKKNQDPNPPPIITYYFVSELQSPIDRSQHYRVN